MITARKTDADLIAFILCISSQTKTRSMIREPLGGGSRSCYAKQRLQGKELLGVGGCIGAGFSHTRLDSRLLFMVKSKKSPIYPYQYVYKHITCCQRNLITNPLFGCFIKKLLFFRQYAVLQVTEHHKC